MYRIIKQSFHTTVACRFSFSSLKPIRGINILLEMEPLTKTHFPQSHIEDGSSQFSIESTSNSLSVLGKSSVEFISCENRLTNQNILRANGRSSSSAIMVSNSVRTTLKTVSNLEVQALKSNVVGYFVCIAQWRFPNGKHPHKALAAHEDRWSINFGRAPFRNCYLMVLCGRNLKYRSLLYIHTIFCLNFA